jgi:hypothetical protein
MRSKGAAQSTQEIIVEAVNNTPTQPVRTSKRKAPATQVPQPQRKKPAAAKKSAVRHVPPVEEEQPVVEDEEPTDPYGLVCVL